MIEEQEEANIESVDVELLRVCVRSREDYERHKDLIKSYMLTEIAWGLLGDIGEYYAQRPGITSIEESDFKTWFRLQRHPAYKPEKHKLFGTILSNICSAGTPASPSVVSKLVEERIKESISLAAKSGNVKDIPELLEDLENVSKSYTPSSKFVTDTVESVVMEAIRTGGYNWRLEDLNMAVGPVSKGDLIIVGKRPEVGGTSFVISEITHMVTQLPEDKGVLFINNEEYKTKIVTRLVGACLDMDTPTIYTDPAKASVAYYKYLSGRTIDLMSDGAITSKEVESALKTGKYGMIVFNTLEKIHGFGGKGVEDYQRIERLGQWARKLALTYGPVFCIVQADASAVGVKYLDESMLYKTKTGLQSEADLLIMIGKSNDPSDPDNSRYIHVAKNKLPGTLKTMPSLRHLKSEVEFNPDTGRYKSKVKWTTK